MKINLVPLSRSNDNYLDVIDLYKEAFTTVRNIPTWLLKFKLRNGKDGFNVIYAGDIWVGLIYTTEYKDIVFVHFFAISEPCRSSGYGSKVIDLLKTIHTNKKLYLTLKSLMSERITISKDLNVKLSIKKMDSHHLVIL